MDPRQETIRLTIHVDSPARIILPEYRTRTELFTSEVQVAKLYYYQTRIHSSRMRTVRWVSAQAGEVSA